MECRVFEWYASAILNGIHPILIKIVNWFLLIAVDLNEIFCKRMSNSQTQHLSLLEHGFI